MTPSSSAGRRHHHLEGRARRILSLHGAVVQRLQRVLDQRVPLGRLDAAREDVRIEGRPATPSPGPRRCAGRARRRRRCGPPSARSAACWRSRSMVSTRVLPGTSRHLREHAQRRPERVDLDLLAARRRADRRPTPSRGSPSRSGRRGGSPRSSSSPARSRSPRRRSRGDARPAGRTDRCAAGPTCSDTPGSSSWWVSSATTPRPVEVAPHHDALERRALRRRAQRARSPHPRAREVARRASRARRDVVRVLGHEHDVERRPIVDQDLAVAIVDHAARRRARAPGGCGCAPRASASPAPAPPAGDRAAR